MIAKTLMVLGAGPLQIPAILAAKRMGLRVVVLDGNPTAPGLPFGHAIHIVDISDEEVCLSVARKERVSGVVHICSEVSMRVLGRINDELGLHGISYETALKATNKELMRQAFVAGLAPSPRCFGATTESDALKAANNLRWPIIVKPSRSSGSRGVTRLDDSLQEPALIRAFHRAVAESRDRSAVVEEFVGGPEFSVEMLIWNGHAQILTVTDKVTSGAPYFVETGHSQPTWFSEEARLQVEDAARRGVKALGIDWSAAHAEVRLNPQGPYLMEIGARLGGDFITTELVPRSTGIDMVAAAIQLALGQVPDLAPQHLPQGAAIRYLSLSPGTVNRIGGVAEARLLPGVKVVKVDVIPGDRVGVLDSSLARTGYVIAEGLTAEAAIQNAELALNAIVVMTS